MMCELLTNIFIPLISAFIGGAVTFWGVKITINYEKECRVEDKKRFFKPFFISLNKYDNEVKGRTAKIDFEVKDNQEGMYSLINGYIKNFDFSHFIIEKIVINKTSYYPVMNYVIEKNAIVEIEVFGDKKNIENAILYTRDILDNLYLYKLVFEEDTENPIKIIKKYKLVKEV